jgi:methionyl-tRNA formyltransferase
VRKNFSCYIINETSLGLQCAEALFKEGHEILGMISTHKDTVAWVTKQNIPLYSSLEDFKASTSSKTFDYLFSIVNRKIIKKELLAYPRAAAINYHDAPLPKYAGVHATSWAILNNEPFHGISWHLMNEMTDGGGILKQVTFPLDKDETALTLNLKCYSHALESFRILIQELVKGSLIEKKQDLTKRSYFARDQKPNNLGFLCWEDLSLIHI